MTVADAVIFPELALATGRAVGGGGGPAVDCCRVVDS